MNSITVSEVLSKVPEGVAAEVKRQRLTAVIGLAVSQMVQLPGAVLEGTNRSTFFSENASALRDILFQFNEVVPFNVDRAMDIGYQVWNTRYRLVYECTPEVLLGGVSMGQALSNVIPEIESLGITPMCITSVTALIKSYIQG